MRSALGILKPYPSEILTVERTAYAPSDGLPAFYFLEVGRKGSLTFDPQRTLCTCGREAKATISPGSPKSRLFGVEGSRRGLIGGQGVSAIWEVRILLGPP